MPHTVCSLKVLLLVKLSCRVQARWGSQTKTKMTKRKTSTKPDKAQPANAQCPAQAVAHTGGINWGRAYYDTELKAQQVGKWISEGSSYKWSHARWSVSQVTVDGISLWELDHHRDNTRSPSWAEQINGCFPSPTEYVARLKSKQD